MSFSLPPRFDLFSFKFPVNFIPQELNEKYFEIMNKNNKNFISNPLDMLNESLNGISFPGLSNTTVIQNIGFRRGDLMTSTSEKTFNNPTNPLNFIDKTITMSFRHMQGFLNYFLLYEIFLWKKDPKNRNKYNDDLFTIDIIDSDGVVVSQIILFQPIMDEIDKLEMEFSKIERANEMFTLTFRFTNIDMEFQPIQLK